MRHFYAAILVSLFFSSANAQQPPPPPVPPSPAIATLQAPNITSRPSPLAVWPTNAFTGTRQYMAFGYNYNVSGAGTAGTPSGGTSGSPVYIVTTELSAIQGVYTNSSGSNPDLGDNYNRTQVAAETVWAIQNGQGDLLQRSCNGQLNSNLSGATSWNASPALTCLGGGLSASAGGAGGFINPINWVVNDNNNAIAVIMESAAGNRQNSGSAIGQIWGGTLWQSTNATNPWDFFFSGQGQVKVAVDLTNITTQTSGLVHAAIIRKANDCDYFNGTAGTLPKVVASATGGDSICYNSTAGGIQISNGTSGLGFETLNGQNVSLVLMNMLMGSASNYYLATGSSPTGTTGSCSVVTFTGGLLAGSFVAPVCAAGTIILSALTGAINGYSCSAIDRTTPADTVVEIATGTTFVTFRATTALNDVVQFSCIAY